MTYLILRKMLIVSKLGADGMGPPHVVTHLFIYIAEKVKAEQMAIFEKNLKG